MYPNWVKDGSGRPRNWNDPRRNPRHAESFGCHMDSCGRDPTVLGDNVIATRKKIAEIQNEAVNDQGFKARVDAAFASKSSSDPVISI